MTKKSIVILALVALFVSANAFAAEGAKPNYVNGVYVGKAESHGGELTVTVRVKGKKIVSVEVNATDSAGISDAAIEELPATIIEKQSADVDVVSGATETSEAIKTAVADALSQAIPKNKK